MTNGARDLSEGGGSPAKVDPDTVFQLASVSKPLASTIVAGVVGSKKIAWNDPIIRSNPRFALKSRYVTRKATFADLMSHRSGLYTGSGDLLEDLGFGRGYILAHLKQQPLDAFRSVYHYSNFGYTEAGQAAADALQAACARQAGQTERRLHGHLPELLLRPAEGRHGTPASCGCGSARGNTPRPSGSGTTPATRSASRPSARTPPDCPRLSSEPTHTATFVGSGWRSTTPPGWGRSPAADQGQRVPHRPAGCVRPAGPAANACSRLVVICRSSRCVRLPSSPESPLTHPMVPESKTPAPERVV